MFNIDLLINDTIESILEQKEKISDKVEVLIKLVDYENEFSEYADDISDFYSQNTNERYENSHYYLNDDDKEFIIEYAVTTENIAKTKALLNDILSTADGEMDYDEVISSAQNEITSIANIGDFDLSGDKDNSGIAKDTRRSYKGFLYPQKWYCPLAQGRCNKC